MIPTLQQSFGTMTKALEVVYVIEGIKPVARLIVDEDKIDKVNEIFSGFLKNYGLYTTLSEFKIKKEVEEDKQYSNKGFRIDKDSDEKGSFFLYVSRSKEKAEEAKSYEFLSLHKELGLLLGYPECCCRFFQENFAVESEKQNDYVLASLKNSEGVRFPFENNVAIRHLDLTLLSHFPCSLNCEQSVKLARKHSICISRHSREIGMIFDGMLKGIVLYTAKIGVFLFRGVVLHGNKFNYNGIIGSAGNEIYNKLKNSEVIEIIDKNTIRLGNDILSNLGIMVFE